jgi:hypothetical protein
MQSVFIELKFWLLIVLTFGTPVLIYGVLLRRRAIGRMHVLLLGVALVLIAGIDAYLLQALKSLALQTPTLIDDFIFASELSLALYALPALYAGVGVNVVSHVLIEHLQLAEREAEHEAGLGGDRPDEGIVTRDLR